MEPSPAPSPSHAVLDGAHSRWVHDCCWAARGRLAVSAGFEGTVLVRRVPAASGALEPSPLPPVVTLQHEGRVRACCPLGGSGAVATASGVSVHCWGQSFGSVSSRPVRSIELESLFDEVQAVAAGPRGTILAGGTPPKQRRPPKSNGAEGAVGSCAGSVAVLDQRAGSSAAAAVLTGHAGTVWQLRWSPHNSHQVCSASADSTAKVWDLRTNAALDTLAGDHRGGVRTCAFAGSDLQLKRWILYLN